MKKNISLISFARKSRKESFVKNLLKCKSPEFPQDRFIGIANLGRVEKESSVWIALTTSHVIRRTGRCKALNAPNNLRTDHSIRRQPLERLSSSFALFFLWAFLLSFAAQIKNLNYSR